MNNSKRVILSLLVIILIMVSSMALLVSCVETTTEAVVNEVSVYIGDDNIEGAYPFTIDTDKLLDGANVSDMIEATTLLYADLQDGAYGMFLASIGNLVPDPSYQFIAVYTTDTSVDVSDDIEPITHDDKTFYSSNVGISGIPVKTGESYAFILLDFGAAPETPIVTPIEADYRLKNLASTVNVNIEPTVAYSEKINTLLRAGVKFTDTFYSALSADLVAAIALFSNENAMASDRGIVLYTTSVLLYAGKDIPNQAIEYINDGEWIDDAAAEWTCGVLLPVINELSNAGYDMTVVEERAISELMSAAVDGEFAMLWSSVDSAAVAIIAVLPYYDRPEVKAVVDKTLRSIESKMDYDNNANNICGTAYVLALAVESKYYGVKTSLPTDAIYTWILSKQSDNGSIGYPFEGLQALRALSSYQINKNGNGTFFSYVK